MYGHEGENELLIIFLEIVMRRIEIKTLKTFYKWMGNEICKNNGFRTYNELLKIILEN